MTDDVFECHAEAVFDSGKALKCVFEDGREVWVPHSVIHDNSEVYTDGHSGNLVIKGWFARKEGLSDD